MQLYAINTAISTKPVKIGKNGEIFSDTAQLTYKLL